MGPTGEPRVAQPAPVVLLKGRERQPLHPQYRHS